MADPTPDDDLPIRRDAGFLVKLVLFLVLGAAGAALIGWKLKSAAAGCGAGLIRPGETVIPTSSQH